MGVSGTIRRPRRSKLIFFRAKNPRFRFGKKPKSPKPSSDITVPNLYRNRIFVPRNIYDPRLPCYDPNATRSPVNVKLSSPKTKPRPLKPKSRVKKRLTMDEGGYLVRKLKYVDLVENTMDIKLTT